MTSPPSYHPKRRWRWLTATALLLLLGIVTWRVLFDSDPRFVGKWQIVIEQDGKQVVTNEVLWYYDDGTCRQAFDGKETPGKMHWWVSGDQFVIDSRTAAGFERLKQSAMDIWTRLRTGTMPRTGHVCFTVVNVTEGEINLQVQPLGNGPTYFVWNRRLPE